MSDPSKLRVLIADDEALSRQRLKQFLAAEPGTEIVAECSTGREALDAVHRAGPNLLFLDVKMPDLDGLDVVAGLDRKSSPAVIFVTAHDQFAVRAFEVQAVDYLLKPFDRARFQSALQRARVWLQSRPAARKSLVNLGGLASPLKSGDRVAIKSNGRISLIQTDEIDWICAADNYSELHVGKASHLLRTTLSSLMAQLPPDRFLRISRSHLVNLERIQEMRPKSHGDYVLILRDGTRLTGSRNYRQHLVGLFSL